MNAFLSIFKGSDQRVKSNRDFLWNAVGMSANSLNSLFFLIIVKRISGTADAGIFSFCFANAMVFYTIALYGVRAYQVTDVNKQRSNGDYISARIVTCIGSLAIAMIFAFANRYDPYKFSVLMLLVIAKILESLSDVYYGIMQINSRLDIAGKANFIKSALGLLCFSLILLKIHSLFFACAALVVINLAVFVLYERRWVGKMQSEPINFTIKPIAAILTSCFSVFAVSSLSIYLVNAPRYAIDQLMTDKAQGIYGMIMMPGTAVSLFTGFLIQFFLSNFARKIANKDKAGFAAVIIKLTALIVLFTAVIELFLGLFGVWLFRFIFNTDVSLYLLPLMLNIVGVSLISIATLFFSALTALRSMRLQLYIILADTLLAFVVSTPLVHMMGIMGASIAYCIFAGFQFIATGIALTAVFKKAVL